MTVYIPKYNIGDVLYMARSYERPIREVEIIDGKEFIHTSSYFEPVVKKKSIVGITIHVSENKVEYQYQAKNEGPFPYPSHYKEDELDRCFKTHGEALHVAEEYAIHKKQEYYG